MFSKQKFLKENFNISNKDLIIFIVSFENSHYNHLDHIDCIVLEP